MLESVFNYHEAFSRNLGWLTEQEQAQLRDKTVAIAGVGGVGGHHLLTLTRLGIGHFRIADGDTFELANFNRQTGASCSSLGQSKVETMARLAHDINPEAKIDCYPAGISPDNVDQFLAGADVYIDGLDFFAFDIRQVTFAACHRLGIPAVTAAPLGMGTAWLVFMPGHMSFNQYFRWDNCSDTEKAVRFLVGLAPARLHNYLVDYSRLNLTQQRGPSTAMGCYLCAGVAATEALKILLKRGPIRCAPHGQQFDAYRGRLVKTWRPGGNANPMQRLAIAIGLRQLAAYAQG